MSVISRFSILCLILWALSCGVAFAGSIENYSFNPITNEVSFDATGFIPPIDGHTDFYGGYFQGTAWDNDVQQFAFNYNGSFTYDLDTLATLGGTYYPWFAMSVWVDGQMGDLNVEIESASRVVPASDEFTGSAMVVLLAVCACVGFYVVTEAVRF